MSTAPLPPEPEQIVPPSPPSRRKIIGMAVGVVVILVVAIVVLRIVTKPGAPDDSNLTALPLKGDPKAPLTIFEYASFGCEHCAKVQPMIKEILSRYDGKVKLVYIHFPIGQVPNAVRASMAGVCASEQGKFWQFEEIMFERQSSWIHDANPEPLWFLYAGQVGMDTNLLQKCLASENTGQVIQQQLMMGGSQMVQLTPTFLIGGSRLVNPHSIEEFVKVIEKELAALKKG